MVPNFFNEQTRSESALLSDKAINLGLDLRGGSYLLLEIDFNGYVVDQLESLSREVYSTLSRNKDKNHPTRYRRSTNKASQNIVLDFETDGMINEKTLNLIRGISDELEVSLAPDSSSKVLIGYTSQALDEMRKRVLDQSIEIVRRRVDETGTREPDIQRQGDTRILLQVPGLENPEQLKRLLGRTAKMTFHLLDNSMPYPDTGSGAVPPGSKRVYTQDRLEAYVIKRQIEIHGNLLADARAGFNQNSQPVVNLRFNSRGAEKFAEITKNNIGKPFAIVLDNKVVTAPVIRSSILDGQAEISGAFTVEEANDVAVLLRTGSLPASIDIVEERTVGPSLGQDSIDAGARAILLALVLVIIFMLLSYGKFGLMADISLLMNMVLIIAVMSLFEATLTLPGIAGIVLTMGMAVDANVLIYERIREEIRNGLSPFAAVDHGYRHAFKTIIDSNLTTLIAALLLFQFGSGPIKGFAVTLSIGIMSSMFSAILLNRLMVVTWLKRKRPSTLSI